MHHQNAYTRQQYDVVNLKENLNALTEHVEYTNDNENHNSDNAQLSYNIQELLKTAANFINHLFEYNHRNSAEGQEERQVQSIGNNKNNESLFDKRLDHIDHFAHATYH